MNKYSRDRESNFFVSAMGTLVFYMIFVLFFVMWKMTQELPKAEPAPIATVCFDSQGKPLLSEWDSSVFKECRRVRLVDASK
jgi:hypothetical protein